MHPHRNQLDAGETWNLRFLGIYSKKLEEHFLDVATVCVGFCGFGCVVLAREPSQRFGVFGALDWRSRIKKPAVKSCSDPLVLRVSLSMKCPMGLDLAQELARGCWQCQGQMFARLFGWLIRIHSTSFNNKIRFIALSNTKNKALVLSKRTLNQPAGATKALATTDSFKHIKETLWYSPMQQHVKTLDLIDRTCKRCPLTTWQTFQGGPGAHVLLFCLFALTHPCASSVSKSLYKLI